MSNLTNSNPHPTGWPNQRHVMVLVHSNFISPNYKGADKISDEINSHNGPVVSVDYSAMGDAIEPKHKALMAAWKKSEHHFNSSGYGPQLMDAAGKIFKAYPNSRFTVTGAAAANAGMGCATTVHNALKNLGAKSELSKNTILLKDYNKAITNSFPGHAGRLGLVGGSAPKGIVTYHGTPYDFKKFSSSHIGSGEGAQAYGHGIYLAENPDVAKEYAETLGGNSWVVNGKTVKPKIWSEFESDGNKNTAEDYAAKAMQSESNPTAALADRSKFQDKNKAAAAVAMIARGQVRKSDGNIYQTEIQASPDEFLDWDKPFGSKISSKILSGINSVETMFDATAPKANGEGLYHALEKSLGGDKQASEFLLKNGIKGIRYLDQGSRSGVSKGFKILAEDGYEIGRHTTEDEAKNEQALLDNWKNTRVEPFDSSLTRTYVIFDPSIIKVTHKNGEVVKNSKECLDEILLNSFPDHHGIPGHQGGSLPKGETADEPVKGEKAQDFGKKIGGAKKDLWKLRGLNASDFDSMTDTEKSKLATKKEVMPAPDYSKWIADGMSPEIAYAAKKIKDAIAAAPVLSRSELEDPVKRQERQRKYVEVVGMIRDELPKIRTVEDIRALDEKIYPPTNQVDARGMASKWDDGNRETFSLIGGRKLNDAMRISQYKLNSYKEEIAKTGWPEPQEQWERQFEIKHFSAGTPDYKRVDGKFQEVNREKDSWAVVKKGTYRVLGEYDDEKSAQDFAKSQVTKAKSEPQRPLNPDATRVAKDYRQGKDVSGQDILDTFGFRGGEFGNWTNEKDRQQSLNQTFDALHDMADVLQIPPKAVSLDGQLGIAFGARGGGKAAAHYESGSVVINLTRTRGSGALAHEWGHALDDYFGRQASGGRPAQWVSHGNKGGTLRPEVAEAWNGVMKAIGEKPMTKEEMAAPEIKDVARGKMAINSVAQQFVSSAKGQPHEQVVSDMMAMLRGEKPREKNGDKLDPAFIIKGLQAFGKQPGMTGLSKMSADSLAQNVRFTDWHQNRLDRINRGEIQLMGDSDMKKRSTEEGEYWVRPHEMFARSFESYVGQKLEDRGESSPYLVQGVPTKKNSLSGGVPGGDRPADPDSWGNLYPLGEEREKIHGAMANLFKVIRVDDGKVMNSNPHPTGYPNQRLHATGFLPKQPDEILVYRGGEIGENKFPWFTEDPNEAAKYGDVKPYYLKVKNPTSGSGGFLPSNVIAAGHDAVRFENPMSKEGNYDGQKPQWVPMDKSQIRPADSENSEIHHSSSGIPFVKDASSSNMVPVLASVARMEPAWQANKEMYVGKGGAGGIGGRYDRFGAWMAGRKEPVEMPRVGLGYNDPSMVGFGNGRHRWAWLRDNGETAIPVVVDKEQAEEFKKRFGVDEKLKNDKDRLGHGSEKRAITAYHGTKADFNQFSEEHQQPDGWLSKGFYFTTNKDEARNYGDRVLSVKLALQNPLVLDNDTLNPDGSVSFAGNAREQLYKKFPETASMKHGEISGLLKKKGYDGVVYGDMISAFNPNQISITKSEKLKNSSNQPLSPAAETSSIPENLFNARFAQFTRNTLSYLVDNPVESEVKQELLNSLDEYFNPDEEIALDEDIANAAGLLDPLLKLPILNKAIRSWESKKLLNSFQGHAGRPGERGGSLPKGEGLSVEDFKRKITHEKSEVAGVFSKDGKFLFETTSDKTHSVSFSDEQAKQMAGCVLIHNHPSGISAMSAADVHVLLATGAYKTIVVTPSYEYSMTNPTLKKEMVPDLEKTYNSIYRKESQRIRKGSGDIFFGASDLACKTIAEKYGLEFSRTRIEKLTNSFRDHAGRPGQVGGSAPAGREEKIARIKELKSQASGLAAKGGLSRAEAEHFTHLNKEINSLRFDVVKPLEESAIPPAAERHSAVPSSVVLAARNNLFKDKPVWMAIADAATGVSFNANTAVDEIMLGNNKDCSASKFYHTFDDTRAALLAHNSTLRTIHPDSLTLYRAVGAQQEKPTTNWASTEAIARQYGDRVISKVIPVKDVLALNVGMSGKYEEFIVGRAPTVNSAMAGVVDANGAVKTVEGQDTLNKPHRLMGLGGSGRFRYHPDKNQVQWTDTPTVEQIHAVDNHLAKSGIKDAKHTDWVSGREVIANAKDAKGHGSEKRYHALGIVDSNGENVQSKFIEQSKNLSHVPATSDLEHGTYWKYTAGQNRFHFRNFDNPKAHASTNRADKIYWNLSPTREQAISVEDHLLRKGFKPTGHYGNYSSERFCEHGEDILNANPHPTGWPNERIFYHGSPSGEFHGGHYGIHIGTQEAAREALESRIGIRADGKDWDGTREYGKTLLAGGETQKRIGRGGTGYNSGMAQDGTGKDFYPTEKTHHASYGDGTPVDFASKPNLFAVKIKGEMSNTPERPMSDTRANAQMAGQQKKGNARRGYYYQNDGEDAGSISAVVPNGDHLEVLKNSSTSNQESGNFIHNSTTKLGFIQPSAAEKEAGNYPKKHIRYQGLNISIETPAGTSRSGVGKDGQRWENVHPNFDYGYFTGFKNSKADSDPVDVYISKHPSQYDPVYVIDQLDPDTGAFDEHKCVIANSPEVAKQCYIQGFSDKSGESRLGGMVEMSIGEFKEWLKSGVKNKPVSQ